MKFSTRSRYALRFMIDLAASRDDDYVSLKDVSDRQGISVKYLEQIVPPLARAGLVTSSRGARGGYKLTKDASQYTPGDIIRAIEGPVAVVSCLDESAGRCDRAGSCQTVAFWSGLNDAVDGYLDSMTLQDMAVAGKKHLKKKKPAARKG